MKQIEPSYEVVKYDGSDMKQVLEHLEACGRTCYKSDHKIRQGSSEIFVKGLMKAGHEAMIEHASIAVEVGTKTFEFIRDFGLFNGSKAAMEQSGYTTPLEYFKDVWYAKIALNFMNFSWHDDIGFVISGNFRAWRNLLKVFTLSPILTERMQVKFPVMFEDIDKPTFTLYNKESVQIIEDIEDADDSARFLHKQVSVRFVCNRGFTHELVRMRPCSFAQESTRYVNYKEGMTAITPPTWDIWSNTARNLWKDHMEEASHNYSTLVAGGLQAQDARGVLPIDVKTEIVLTTNLAEWHHIFGLRCANSAHPSMRELMRPLCDDFKKSEPKIFEDIIW